MIAAIFVCDTLYQIIVACCIQRQLKEPSALILTDHTFNMHEVYARMLKHSTLFQSVIFVEAIKFSMESEKYTDQHIDFEIMQMLQENGLTHCNHLFIGTLDRYMQRLFYVLKHDFCQKDILGAIIEDGFATYSFYGKVIRSYKYFDDFKELYLYEPVLLSWKTNMNVFKIDSSCFNEEKFITELNNIFAFYEMRDTYEEKYIVLASSYSEIAQMHNLKTILKDLEQTVGKDEIIIKTHPRVINNIYKECGFKTSYDLSVPWEIIALNYDLSNKVIITSFSGALYTPKILFNKKMTGISVMKFADQDDPYNLMEYYQKYVLKHYQNGVYIPGDRKEFRDLLNRFCSTII